jgi:hypothetical protein
MIYKIAWIDSVGLTSYIHLTTDGKDTRCGGHAKYLAHRTLVRAPLKKGGVSNYCQSCFKGEKKSAPWWASLQ